MFNKTWFFFVFALVGGSCISPGTFVCKKYIGTYSGTSVMGSSIGTAILVIEEDCHAELSYYHGDLGSATETGYVVEEGSELKFQSTEEGGTYDLIIRPGKVVLDGASWHCEMTQ